MTNGRAAVVTCLKSGELCLQPSLWFQPSVRALTSKTQRVIWHVALQDVTFTGKKVRGLDNATMSSQRWDITVSRRWLGEIWSPVLSSHLWDDPRGKNISTIPHYKDVFVEISSLICFV